LLSASPPCCDMHLGQRLQRSVWVGAVDRCRCVLQMENECALVNMKMLAEESCFQMLLLFSQLRSENRIKMPLLKLVACRNSTTDGLDAYQILSNYMRSRHEFSDTTLKIVVLRSVHVLDNFRHFLAQRCGFIFSRLTRGTKDLNGRRVRECVCNSNQRCDTLQLLYIPDLHCFRNIDASLLVEKLAPFLLLIVDALHNLGRSAPNTTRIACELRILRLTSVFIVDAIRPQSAQTSRPVLCRNDASVRDSVGVEIHQHHRRKAEVIFYEDYLQEWWRMIHLAPWFRVPADWQKPETGGRGAVVHIAVGLEQLYKVFERC